MERTEVETVLANWIEQAYSSVGSLPSDVDRAGWIAARFTDWWRRRIEETLSDAEAAAFRSKNHLADLGGWESFGEAMHEHVHLQEALAELRGLLGLSTP